MLSCSIYIISYGGDGQYPASSDRITTNQRLGCVTEKLAHFLPLHVKLSPASGVGQKIKLSLWFLPSPRTLFCFMNVQYIAGKKREDTEETSYRGLKHILALCITNKMNDEGNNVFA